MVTVCCLSLVVLSNYIHRCVLICDTDVCLHSPHSYLPIISFYSCLHLNMLLFAPSVPSHSSLPPPPPPPLPLLFSLQPDAVNRTVLQSHQLLPPPTPTGPIFSSPPGYSHIEHVLRPSSSQAPYEKLQLQQPLLSPTTTTTTTTISSSPPDYSKLCHNTSLPFTGPPVTAQPQIHYATLTYPPPSSSPSHPLPPTSTSPPHYVNVRAAQSCVIPSRATPLTSPSSSSSFDTNPSAAIQQINVEKGHPPMPHLPSKLSKMTSI